MKKILLVVDTPGWAFDTIAKEIQKRLNDFQVDITYDITLHGTNTGQYDFIHYMNWLDGCRWASQVSSGVCSHNYHLKWGQRAKENMRRFKRLVAISKILEEKLAGKNANITYIPNGVDTELFKPDHNGNEFTVGFVGQKTSGGFGKGRTNEGIKKWDIKGYELILQPLIRQMEGKVKFKVLDNDSTNAIPYSDMPEWYRHIDVLICTSLFEGCPLPVLEAAACGKPVISTRVGIVPELIKHGENGFIIDSVRSNSDIRNALEWFETYKLMLKEKKLMCENMGLKNRERVVELFSWDKIIPVWREFWKN